MSNSPEVKAMFGAQHNFQRSQPAQSSDPLKWLSVVLGFAVVVLGFVVAILYFSSRPH